MYLLRLPCSQKAKTARSETGLHRISSVFHFEDESLITSLSASVFDDSEISVPN